MQNTIHVMSTLTQVLLRAMTLCLLMPVTIVLAQNKPATTAAQDNPLSAFNRRAYGQMKIWLIRSAEKMPEERYSFKPVDSVRSFGQLIGHLADAQYTFCSIALGEKNPAPDIEKTKSSKADLIAALKEATIYCDKAYNSLTDASAVQMVKFYSADTPKLSVLNMNIAHSSEH